MRSTDKPDPISEASVLAEKIQTNTAAQIHALYMEGPADEGPGERIHADGSTIVVPLGPFQDAFSQTRCDVQNQPQGQFATGAELQAFQEQLQAEVEELRAYVGTLRQCVRAIRRRRDEGID